MTMHILNLEEDGADPRLLRNALGRFATGVTIITTTRPDGEPEGLTANSFSAVSLDPPLVLWSLRKAATTREIFEGAGRFCVNVLLAGHQDISNAFARSSTPNKFAGVAWERGELGCPLLSEQSLAIFECLTETAIEGGDHVIFIGRVVRAHQRDGEPLIFSGGRYVTHAPLDA